MRSRRYGSGHDRRDPRRPPGDSRRARSRRAPQRGPPRPRAIPPRGAAARSGGGTCRAAVGGRCGVGPADGERGAARGLIEAALELADVSPSLVHADLGGENVHWHPDGELAGVLDWDLAQPFDPAVDAACLAVHGWENVREAVDVETYRRAGIWY